MYAPLIYLPSEADYRQYYLDHMCGKTIYTHEGLLVSFRPEKFEHAFHISMNRKLRDKSQFSIERAQRIMWIEKALSDFTLPTRAGWDNKRKRYDQSRRVCVVSLYDYVVIIRVIKPGTAAFVTAFIINEQDVKTKILAGPLWNNLTLCP